MKIKPENRFWIGIYGFTAFIMLLAMSVFGWLAWTSRSEPGIGRVAGARPSPASDTIPDERYELLATFDSPAYIADRDAPKALRTAMMQYTAKDYAGAAKALRAISQAQPQWIAARFYLGISLLQSGDRISGIQELRALADTNAGQYLERARFYLAKGLIGEHDVRRAQQQLNAIVAEHGDLEKQALALIAQIHTS